MIYIAHRGLINGPDHSLENSPDQIVKMLDQGYDCEIDLWRLDNQLYLGHDGAQYRVFEEFLGQPGLWIHAKNLDALDWLTGTDLNYFWHQTDQYTLTSHGYIWAYPGCPTSAHSVQVMPETADPTLQNINRLCHAVCSDYITAIQAQRP